MLRGRAFEAGIQGREMSDARKVRAVAVDFVMNFRHLPDAGPIRYYLKGPHMHELMQRARALSQSTGIKLVEIPEAQRIASLTPDIALQTADMTALRRTVKKWWQENEEFVAARYPCEVLQWVFEFGWAVFLNGPKAFPRGAFSAYLSFRGPRPPEMPGDVPMHRCLVQLRRLACSG